MEKKQKGMTPDLRCDLASRQEDQSRLLAMAAVTSSGRRGNGPPMGV